MTLLPHGRDITSDAAEGMCTGGSTETAADLLLDLYHSQIPLGQVVVKGHGKVIHKSQCLSLILLQAVQQIFTLVLLLAPPPTRERGGFFFLLSPPRLEDRRIALFVLFNGVVF